MAKTKASTGAKPAAIPDLKTTGGPIMLERPDVDSGLLPHEVAVIEAAKSILAAHMRRAGGLAITSPTAAKDMARLQVAGLPYECFAVQFFDTSNRLIAHKEMFRGTLAQTSIYPREVARLALTLGASAVILIHNHPSGLAEPSKADLYMTDSLKTVLALVDCRVLDHLVIGEPETVSFAERGLL